MSPLMLFTLTLLWLLAAAQAVAALFTGWIWSKGYTGTRFFTGFIARRDEHPFHFWATWVGCVFVSILVPAIFLMSP